MKARFVFILFCVCMIAGSTAAFGIELYPVQGPAATQTPPPAFTGKLHSGSTISLAQANGESFQGNYKNLKLSFANAKMPGSPASYPPQPNLAFAWDAVYGQGYFVAHVLGETVSQGLLTGDRGTVLQVEFFGGGDAVAADSKGNIYKMVW
ncbi:MAG: hypothetical protein ABR912_07700 [Terracidiphilus sp.]|jgi:hypothetical protein